MDGLKKNISGLMVNDVFSLMDFSVMAFGIL